jgi:hypothetical protein
MGSSDGVDADPFLSEFVDGDERQDIPLRTASCNESRQSRKAANQAAAGQTDAAIQATLSTKRGKSTGSEANRLNPVQGPANNPGRAGLCALAVGY